MDILECPKCGGKTITQRRIDLYQCIGCDFERDFADPPEESKADLPWFWLVGGAIAVLLIL